MCVFDFLEKRLEMTNNLNMERLSRLVFQRSFESLGHLVMFQIPLLSQSSPLKKQLTSCFRFIILKYFIIGIKVML